jgi:hypothetical protein
MKLRFAITKRQLYVETLLRVKFHNVIQCYIEINREKKTLPTKAAFNETNQLFTKYR